MRDVARRSRVRKLILPVAVVMFTAAPAAAQTTSASAQSAMGPRWEVEAHGGLSRGTAASDGTAALPPAGSPIPSLGPLFPSRRTSSWFFGDGALMLNDANEDLGLAARITPLDAALTSLGLDYSNAAVLGVRVRRVVSDRWSAEFALDLLPGSGDISEEFSNAVDATRVSFESAFRALLTDGPTDSVAVSTVLEASDGSAHELAVTGAVNWHFKSDGLVPYLTFGGGVISGLGSLSSIALEGRYGFVIFPFPDVSFQETDRIRIRFERGTALVGVAGGGVRRNVSDAWGFKIDGRVLIGREHSRILIDADPDVQTRANGDFLEMLTNPNIQFSNDPATGRVSSLSGPALDGFEAFKASGWQARVFITAGVFFRF
jgi:hypothetical protein